VPWNVGRGPVRVVVPAGVPVRLDFDRRDNHRATDYVLIPALGILSTLVPFAASPVHIGPCAPGRYEFQSADGVLRGSLVVVARPDSPSAHASERHETHWPERLVIGGRAYRPAVAGASAR